MVEGVGRGEMRWGGFTIFAFGWAMRAQVFLFHKLICPFSIAILIVQKSFFCWGSHEYFCIVKITNPILETLWWWYHHLRWYLSNIAFKLFNLCVSIIGPQGPPAPQTEGKRGGTQSTVWSLQSPQTVFSQPRILSFYHRYILVGIAVYEFWGTPPYVISQ